MATTKSRCNIVVLVSGNGSNLQSIIDNITNNTIPGTITAVLSNTTAAYGLQRASAANIPTEFVDHNNFTERDPFDQQLQQTIDAYQPDLLVLAGFMRVLTAKFVQHYQGRMLNIHPSLLPHFKGLNTHQRVIDAAHKQHGASVHFVTADLDSGPSILQARIDIHKHDTASTLAKRVLVQEHKIYSLAIKWYAQKRLQLVENTIQLDGNTLETPIIYHDALQ